MSLAPLTSELLDAPRLRHGFFTRAGGVSGGIYASLNAGFGSKDDPTAVAENRDRAAPGTHNENLRAFYRALRRANYNGRLTIEADWTDLPNQVAPTLAALRAQLRDSGY